MAQVRRGNIVPAAAQRADAKYNFNSGLEALRRRPSRRRGAWRSTTRRGRPSRCPTPGTRTTPFGKTSQDLSTGIAWYRKHFKLPADSTGQEGLPRVRRHPPRRRVLPQRQVRRPARERRDGVRLRRHRRAEPAPQENVVAVRIDNAWDYKREGDRLGFQWNDRNFNANYGGINKNVCLHVADKLSPDAAALLQPRHDRRLRLRKRVRHPRPSRDDHRRVAGQERARRRRKTFSYEVVIDDLRRAESSRRSTAADTRSRRARRRRLRRQRSVGGSQLLELGLRLSLQRLHHPEGRRQAVDAVTTRTGFRKTEFGNGLVKLNDRVDPTQRLRPAHDQRVARARHHRAAVAERLQQPADGREQRQPRALDARHAVEAGRRIVRPRRADAGDARRRLRDAMSTGRRWEQRVELMRDAIIYNRNNPSIIFYEAGNKGISEAHMARDEGAARQVRPARRPRDRAPAKCSTASVAE